MLLREKNRRDCTYSSPFWRNLWEVLAAHLLCLNPQRCYVDGQSSSHSPVVFLMFRWPREREQALWKEGATHTGKDKLPDSCAKPREESIERLKDKQRESRSARTWLGLQRMVLSFCTGEARMAGDVRSSRPRRSRQTGEPQPPPGRRETRL